MGELKITDDVSIDGPGAELLTIDASGNDLTPDFDDGKGSRVLAFNDGDRDSLSNMKLRGMRIVGADVYSAFPEGGAIVSYENLIVADAILTRNSATAGAGINSRYGSLTVSDSVISSNHAQTGGGILAFGTGMSLNNVTISDNVADSQGGGIAMRIKGDVDIAHSTLTGNVAQFGGGGMYSVYGNTTISDSLISGNSLTAANPNHSAGGGILAAVGNLTIQDSRVTGNSAGSGGGISISTFNDSFLLVRSTVTANMAKTFGAGVAAGSRAIIAHSSITGNVVAEGAPGFPGRGGGIFHSHPYTDKGLTIQSSTVAKNHAGIGGGVFVEPPGILEVVDSTISENTSTIATGGVHAYLGSIRHSTVVGNLASGSPYFGRAAGLATMVNFNIDHSIIAGNQSGAGVPPDMTGAGQPTLKIN
jgi:hypothetical protein